MARIPEHEIERLKEEVALVSLDYLVFDDTPRRPLHIDDHGLAERLAALAELNPEDRASLLSVLDALLTRTRVRALANDAS